MNQLNKSTRNESISWSRSSGWTRIFIAISLATAITAGAFVAWRAVEGPVQPGNLAQIEPSFSRLDDYGLRHPALFGVGTQDGRLDDYGLRHPALFGQTDQ